MLAVRATTVLHRCYHGIVQTCVLTATVPAVWSRVCGATDLREADTQVLHLASGATMEWLLSAVRVCSQLLSVPCCLVLRRAAGCVGSS